MAIKIIDNCCSLDYLDTLKNIAINSENWNLRYPQGRSVEDKFLKLEIINNNRIKHPFLAGLAMGLLMQIYEAGGPDLFTTEIWQCGISIKDKHKRGYLHTDYEKEKDIGMIKILGILNSDWKEEWGGGFHHNGTSNYIKPTSFCVFDASEQHSAEEIFTDKKRLTIDFQVYRDLQSLEKAHKIGNK